MEILGGGQVGAKIKRERRIKIRIKVFLNKIDLMLQVSTF